MCRSIRGTLLADPQKARRELGWTSKTGFRDLVKLMVDAEVAAVSAPERSHGRAGAV
jgi:GDP-D-mannose dehydratase